MDTKLTLIIDHHVKEDAKKYAKEMGSSLSKLVENYLKLLTAKRKKTENEIPLSPHRIDEKKSSKSSCRF
ncbi:MAG TPA: DUF6364 family protein [Kaistella sp.]|nr:DUF6364 family protein [Kaistella sp.]